ncbi:MAG: GNAT family N-acetyltransferase [Sulfurovaceae bacterium]|nr:GNAT family N-acetyltransferase [Sulfurovaceae bacterium]MDD5549111.1 GNAT family N-acetyltransferase [Sulfurovaceae bacterium]
MNIELIQATTDDASEILALQKIAYVKEAILYNDWNIPPLTQSLSEIQNEFRTSRVIKAIVSTKIIGSVRASFESDICKIGRLIVHPEYQHKGIGSLLMHNIENQFPNAKRFELFTGTKSVDNIRLYRKLGYMECHQQELSPNVRIVFMEKIK